MTGPNIPTNAPGKLAIWRADPVQFVREVFNAEPDAWQRDVLRAFPTTQRIAMQSCRGPGKSTTLSWLIWNFLLTRPHPRIAATSISGDNLQDCLWTELAKWKKRSPLIDSAFQWTKTRIFLKSEPETWWASARTWSRSADQSQLADTLAGLHEDYLLFVLDEVSGIPSAVMASARAGLSSGKETHIVIAGNPSMLEGPLWDACTRERDLWFVVEITGDPDDPKRSPRVDLEWARSEIKKYGRDDPWVMVNVLGKFPPSSINVLLGPDEVSAAMRRSVENHEFQFSQKRLGIDPARFGLDSTVIFPRQGRVAFKYIEMRGARSDEIAARVAHAKQKWHSELEIIDSTGGYGAGTEDALLQAGIYVMPVNFSSKAGDPRYFNRRAEMWFRMCDWVKTGGCLPQSDRLLKELTAPTYTYYEGKFRIEDKDQIKSRLGFSPDAADALCLCFAVPEASTEQPDEDGNLPAFARAPVNLDYDPLRE